MDWRTFSVLRADIKKKSPWLNMCFFLEWFLNLAKWNSPVNLLSREFSFHWILTLLNFHFTEFSLRWILTLLNSHFTEFSFHWILISLNSHFTEFSLYRILISLNFHFTEFSLCLIFTLLSSYLHFEYIFYESLIIESA